MAESPKSAPAKGKSQSDENKAKAEEQKKVEEQVDPTASSEPTSEPVTDSDEPTFTVERLLKEGGEITGFNTADVAGAFHGEDADAEFTRESATARVKAWLGTVVS